MEISSLYTSVPRIMVICYTVPEIWRMTDVIAVFHLGNSLPFYLLNTPKNENLKKKKEKNAGRYHHFTQLYQKIMIIGYTVPEIWHVTDLIVIFHFGLFFALLLPLPNFTFFTQETKSLSRLSFILINFLRLASASLIFSIKTLISFNTFPCSFAFSKLQMFLILPVSTTTGCYEWFYYDKWFWTKWMCQNVVLISLINSFFMFVSSMDMFILYPLSTEACPWFRVRTNLLFGA